MKYFILITLCYLLCRYIKPIWKALIIGVLSYILISLIIVIKTAPPDTKFNFTRTSLTHFAAGETGEFLAYFLIGYVIFFISDKSKKTE